MKFFISFGLALLFSFTGKAQLNSLYRSMSLRQVYINSNQIAAQENIFVRMDYFKQWVHVTGAPQTMAIQFFSKIGHNKNHGIGINYYQHSIGLLYNKDIGLNYTFRMRIQRSNFMGFSLGTSMHTYSLDPSQFLLLNPTNYLLQVEKGRQIGFNGGIGYYQALSAERQGELLKSNFSTSFSFAQALPIHINDNLKIANEQFTHLFCNFAYQKILPHNNHALALNLCLASRSNAIFSQLQTEISAKYSLTKNYERNREYFWGEYYLGLGMNLKVQQIPEFRIYTGIQKKYILLILQCRYLPLLKQWSKEFSLGFKF